MNSAGLTKTTDASLLTAIPVNPKLYGIATHAGAVSPMKHVPAETDYEKDEEI